MDSTKLKEIFDNKLFSDLELILSDDEGCITINVNKIVLYVNSEYFEILLTKFKNHSSNKISINVPNRFASYDVIASFYKFNTNLGQYVKDVHILWKIKCHDYFQTKYDHLIEALWDVKVSPEDFDLLMDVVRLVGYNVSTATLVNNNMPEKHDQIIEEELLKIMDSESFTCECCKIVMGDFVSRIDVIDYRSGNTLRSIDIDEKISAACFSEDKQIIAAVGYSSNTIRVWNIHTCNMILKLNACGQRLYNVKCLSFSKDSRYLISGYTMLSYSLASIFTNDIVIWSVANGNIMGSIPTKSYSSISAIYCTKDDQIVTVNIDHNENDSAFIEKYSMIDFKKCYHKYCDPVLNFRWNSSQQRLWKQVCINENYIAISIYYKDGICLKIFDMSAQLINSIYIKRYMPNQRYMPDQYDDITIAYCPLGENITTGDINGILRTYNIKTGNLISETKEKRIYNLCYIKPDIIAVAVKSELRDRYIYSSKMDMQIFSLHRNDS